MTKFRRIVILAFILSMMLCIVGCGLGPHGVPKGPSEIPKYNVDVTGGGYSLETCTAVGSVTGALHALLYE